MAETAVSRDSSITGVILALKPYSGLAFQPLANGQKDNKGVQKCHYQQGIALAFRHIPVLANFIGSKGFGL
jgi:hypothetical protein